MSGRLPDAWMSELRSRNSLEEVVSEYVPLKQKGRRFWGCCPFHNEKTASFSVDSEAQLYYCFGCHKGGTVITFVMRSGWSLWTRCACWRSAPTWSFPN